MHRSHTYLMNLIKESYVTIREFWLTNYSCTEKYYVPFGIITLSHQCSLLFSLVIYVTMISVWQLCNQFHSPLKDKEINQMFENSYLLKLWGFKSHRNEMYPWFSLLSLQIITSRFPHFFTLNLSSISKLDSYLDFSKQTKMHHNTKKQGKIKQKRKPAAYNLWRSPCLYRFQKPNFL